jgi:16S rRNA C1402 N4-methylase RsmH
MLPAPPVTPLLAQALKLTFDLGLSFPKIITAMRGYDFRKEQWSFAKA